MEQSIRQLQAAGCFRPDDDETDVVFFFPRPVFLFPGHGLLNTISQDFPRGNPMTAYTDVDFYPSFWYAIKDGRGYGHPMPMRRPEVLLSN
jgi:hypothetical protein